MRGWKRSSCPRAFGLEGSGCSLECGSGGRERAACKPQPQQDGGKRTGGPWVAGGGTGRETTQQQRRRGLEEEGGEGLWRHTSSSASSGSPSHQAHSLAPAAPALLFPPGTGTGSTGGCSPCPGAPGSRPGATGDGLPWGGAAVAALAGARIAAAAQRGGAVGVPPGGRGAPGGREKRLCLRPSG